MWDPKAAAAADGALAIVGRKEDKGSSLLTPQGSVCDLRINFYDCSQAHKAAGLERRAEGFVRAP